LMAAQRGATDPRSSPKGAVIAVVGPDAVGKSSVCRGLETWLAPRGPVQRVHLGRPRRSTATHLANLGVRAWRKLLVSVRPARPADGEAEDRLPLLTAFSTLLRALDRRRLAHRCFRQAERGWLIVADRFPGRERGAATGPAIDPARGWLFRLLAALEVRIYRSIPLPHVVVRLDVPLEETLRRNAARPPPKPEAMIRQSHEAVSRLDFADVPQTTLDNRLPLDHVVEEAGTFILARLGKPTIVRAP
jgi:thymidylate kinase